MSLCQRTEASRRLRRPWRAVLATAAVAALAGTMLATTAGAATHAVSSKQTVRASAPTATINMWMEASGTPVDNYWAAQAKAFDASQPGRYRQHRLSRRPASYNPKVAAALAGNNPPALFFGWGGGRACRFINAKVVQPLGDAGQSDAGNPSWKSAFVPSALGAVTFNKEIYGIPVGGTQPVFFFYNKALMAQVPPQLPDYDHSAAE